MKALAPLLIAVLVAGCSVAGVSQSISAPSPTPTQVTAAPSVTEDPCLGMNGGIDTADITLANVSGWTALGYPGGVVASFRVASLYCADVEHLKPSCFLLVSPTGAMKRGDNPGSAAVAKLYNATPWPIDLAPLDTAPVVVGFDGSFLEQSGLALYFDKPHANACP
jgi:hypothetical protein